MTNVEPPRPPPRRRRHRVWLGALGIVSTIVVALATFQSFWLGPLVRQVVLHRSGRTMDFTAMHVGLDRRLDPRIVFDGLTVANAPWATSHEPLIRGAKVVFELDWQGLTTGVWQVKRLVLEDAEIDLERRADGTRNSRLLNPQGNEPARTRVLRVDALRSQMRYADAVTGLQLQIRSAPLVAARPLVGHPASTLTQHLSFEGRQGAFAFTGFADIGAFITLQRTAESFPLEGELRGDHFLLGASGLVADVLAQGRFETDLRLALDPRAGRRAAPFGAVPGALRIAGDAHLSRTANQWNVSHLQLRTAQSEVVGAIDYRRSDRPGDRSMLSARLAAARLDVRDFRSGGTAPDADAAPSKPGTLDVELELSVGRLVSAASELARDATLHASLAGDRLQVRLADAAIADGRGSAELRFDASRSPPESTLDVHLAAVRLDPLLPARLRAKAAAGQLDGRALLHGEGRSLAELAASATGSIEASLHGASVSPRLEAQLALDGLGLLRSIVAGSAQVPVRCAEVELELRKGLGTIRRLAVATPRTTVGGSGSVNLVGRRIDVVLSPSSNVDALLALPRDIHVQGRFDAPTWSLQSRRGATAPPRCGK